MCFHEEPATQTDEDAKNVRYDEYSYNTFVAMPPIPQQDPSDNAIKPGRRERVADPARDLIRRERPVEAARPGHLVYSLVAPRFLSTATRPCQMRLLGTNLRGALRRFRERLISCGVSLVSAIAPERALW